MKNLAAFALFLAVVILDPHLAQAQLCTTPITSWEAEYTLRAKATNAPCGSGGQERCNVQHSSHAVGQLALQTLASCGGLGWSTPDGSVRPTSVFVADSKTGTCFSGAETQTVTNPTGGYTLLLFDLDVAGKTYTFSPNAFSKALLTTTCAGDTTRETISYVYYPLSNWPKTFNLPTTAQTLNAGVSFAGLSTPGAGSANWDFSIALTPNVTVDDDCDRPGGSTIGCENQRLSEDLPLAGSTFHLHYASDRAPSGLGNATAVAHAAQLGGWTLSVHHAYDPFTGTLFLGDGRQRSAYQLGAPVTFNGNTLLTSKDGSEVYVFARSTGRHIETRRPLTGAIEYRFGYDASGRLKSVTDAMGNVTAIERDAVGRPAALVAPYGHRTALSVDANGFLSRVTNPLGGAASFRNTARGLIISRTDLNGRIYTYSYAGGRLSKAADPAGGFTELTRAKASGLRYASTLKTALGRTSRYQNTIVAPWVQNGAQPYSESHINTWPNGLRATSTRSLANGRLSRRVGLPDGSSFSVTSGPDPVWGLQVPFVTNATRTEGGLVKTVTGSRAAMLGTAGNPFSVTTARDTITTNGRTATSTYVRASRKKVSTSPGRRTQTMVLDARERLASLQVGLRAPINFAYDARGRLASATQGSRVTTFSYGADGYMSRATDPMGRTTRFVYDAGARLASMTLPDGRVVAYTYDANGNRTSVRPPGRLAHRFTYTAVDELASYAPPAVAGTGATTYTYDVDRRLTAVTRPGGQTIRYGYDAAGRLASIAAPTGTTTLAYEAGTGRLARAVNSAESLAYAYTGSLPRRRTWSGIVSGSVARTYSSDFWVASELVNGRNSVAYTYDADGLLTKAGALAITRRAADGLITGTTLRVTADTRVYNAFGELSNYTASANGSPIWKVAYARDANGRITRKSETIGGTTNVYTYSYDLAGRLTKAVKNATTNSYAYDGNSNRLSATLAGIKSTGLYDAQDRLTRYGGASYAYTANGELSRRAAGAQITTYSYDVLGNLIGARLPNRSVIAYVVDAENHRVGKRVNGALKAGYLYDGDRIVAQLDGSNQVVARFVYATRATTPDYMIARGITYRIFSDERGSPVLVVNAATGAIAERITYDEFGRVIADTSPALQPFRLGGGLYDTDTKLVRFGARDYDPAIGRWTTKDPILFDGRDTNLYGYVLNDPVNLTDPTGLDGEECSLKDKLEELVRYLIGKPKIGPITIDPDTRSMSTGASIKVQLEGRTVAEASAKTSIGITEGNNPNGNLFVVKVKGALKVLGWTVAEKEVSTEFGDANKDLTQGRITNEYLQEIDRRTCERCNGN